MKVLIITRHYLDQHLGGPNCSKAFIKAITNIYDDCTLIYPEHHDKHTELSHIVNGKTHLIPCFDKRNKIIKCLDMYRGKIHRFGKTAKETYCDTCRPDENGDEEMYLRRIAWI